MYKFTFYLSEYVNSFTVVIINGGTLEEAHRKFTDIGFSKEQLDSLKLTRVEETIT